MRALALMLALALAGCAVGSDREARAPFLRAVLDATRGAVGRGPVPVDARDVIDAAFLDAAGGPVLLAVPRLTDTGNTLIPVARNRGTVQWTDIAGAGLLTRDGVLVGTRGLGHDMMGADASATRAALRMGGGARLPRVEHRLTPDNRSVRLHYLCDVVPVGREVLRFYGPIHATTIYEERCLGEGPPLRNRYWVDGGGVVRRQAVAVSPEVGILDIDLLRD